MPLFFTRKVGSDENHEANEIIRSKDQENPAHALMISKP
jgi:hypothetical protein